MDSDWLEPHLARDLDRVTAPDELWDRIQNPPVVTRPSRVVPRLVWAAAALVVVAASWGVLRRGTPETNEALAVRALARGFDDVDYRCDQAPQIRSWVKEHTGLDVPLRAETAPSIHLVGANVTPGRVNSAEVVYSVAGGIAVLLVSKAESTGSANGTHRFLSSELHQGTRVYSWTMRGTVCTLACAIPQNQQSACLLCHADGASRHMVN